MRGWWNFPTWRPSVTSKRLVMYCSLLVWVVFGGARIRYGTEVSWFVKCLPSSTGEIHHYDTEVRKNNFRQVLASGDKILWRDCRRWSAIFFLRKNKTWVLMEHIPLCVANDQYNRKCSSTCLLSYRNKKSGFCKVPLTSIRSAPHWALS